MAKKEIKNKKELAKEKRIKAKEQIKSENNILRNLLVGLGFFVILIIVFMIASDSSGSFTHEDVDFELVREGELLLYRTDVPVIFQDKRVPYNFFLRNDPRELNEIPFEGDFEFLPVVVLNSTRELDCDGDGIIAVANLINMYKVAGSNVIKNDTVSCDTERRYSFINLYIGDETRIEEIGEACYDVTINNCEILKATERIMVEGLIEMNKLI